MSDMRERLARAIAHGHGCKIVVCHSGGESDTVASRAGYGHWGHSAEQYAEKHWRDYTQAAAFALSALREPTDAMKEAAYQHVEIDDRWMVEDDQQWTKSWQGAIDAALEEPKPCP